MNTDQVGQWGEHMAAAWFIKQGYDVYFPKSTKNSCIDFIVEKDNKTFRIQVKASSHTHMSGRMKTPAPRVQVRNKGGFDFLFAIHTCGKARLYPIDECPSYHIKFPLGMRKVKKNIYDIELF